MAAHDRSRLRIARRIRAPPGGTTTIPGPLFTSATVRSSDTDREVLVADALKISTGLRDGWIDVATQEDYSSEVARVDVPVAVIAGDADKVDPLDVVKAHILPAFRNPETHFLKSKGHLLPIEAPRELVEILGKFAARAFA